MLIELKSINKTYSPGLFKKKIQAVANLSIDVCRGEVFGLIGLNGAGKSTTIRMLLGLIRPDSGFIRFSGKPLGEASIQQDIGYLPESPYLYDHLSLLELLVFCGRASGLDSGRIKQRGSELMDKLNLSAAQKRPLRTFSKGMLQRAGICFALLHDPAIVILDEPMSGLDPIGRKLVFDLVMELKQQGKTIFFCSHILNDVERLCDRIGLMDKGRLVREFKREDFFQESGKAVFLQTTGLSSEQQDTLRLSGVSIRDEVDGSLLAIPDKQYAEVSRYLGENDIEVLSSRSEWMSLEELFMCTVHSSDASLHPLPEGEGKP